MKSNSRAHTDHGQAGLTLLEVLAATMIFAMVMTVLIGTSSTAVHHVGVSARRLEASLLADELLADLEIQMKQGIAPEVEEAESTRDQYAIRILRTDLAPDLEAAGSNDSETGVAALLGTDLPEVAKHLKQYDIEVSWFEQNGPQHVTRTTFAFDWELAAVEFSDLFQRSGGNGGNGIAGGGSGGEGRLGGEGGSRGRGRGRGPRGADDAFLLDDPDKKRRCGIQGHNASLDRDCEQ